MIILEGPDGAGKTTLGKMLVINGLVDEVMPSPKLSKQHNDSLYKASHEYLFAVGENRRIAVDRFFFSEMVCGPVLRSKIVFNSIEIIRMARYIYQHCFIVFCLPGKENLKFKQDESPRIIENINELYNMYCNAHNISSVMSNNVFSYKWNDPESYQRLERKLKEWQQYER